MTATILDGVIHASVMVAVIDNFVLPIIEVEFCL